MAAVTILVRLHVWANFRGLFDKVGVLLIERGLLASERLRPSLLLVVVSGEVLLEGSSVSVVARDAELCIFEGLTFSGDWVELFFLMRLEF